MSLSGSGDFESDLLAAKERDLKPLLEESEDWLGLDRDQAWDMESFLNDAWFSGSRSGHAQMRARALERRVDVRAVATERLEAEFKDLMEESANALNLSVPLTIGMWGFLEQAWFAGLRTCEAEIMALLLELKSDVAEEAQEWLEGGGEPDS